MAVPKTSLSAGAIIHAILLGDAEVAARARSIFPVAVVSAELPYIQYRRVEFEPSATKAGKPGSDTVSIEVNCFTAGYAEGVELAEAVRAALDYACAEHDGIVMRSCLLAGSEEGYEDDAFVQQLVFAIKI